MPEHRLIPFPAPDACMGCEDKDLELYPLKFVYLVHKPSGTILGMWACRWCLEVVDNCDPVTGAYGAAACEHRRATFEEVALAGAQASEAQPSVH